jgi:hypothetical protein
MPNVRYRWLLEEEGGRLTLPLGPSLRIPIKLLTRDSTWPNEAWSVEFKFQCPPDRSDDHFGSVEYCVPNAPHGNLLAGTVFELMEGAKAVVRGIIV